jgi:hydrogenase-1 operon protein HyaF
MTALDLPTRSQASIKTGINLSLYAEIADSLEQFAETGAVHKIDLRSLPMTEGDREELDEKLGVGEVRADLAVIGKSEVWETAFNGVWRVRHFGAGPAVVADEIIVAAIPDILMTHPDDARAASNRLRKLVLPVAKTEDAENV